MSFGSRLTPLLFCLALNAAQAQDSQPTTTLHVESRIVLLDIAVTDAQGKPVTDLQPHDFHIFENVAPQRILSFEPPSAHTMPPESDGKAIVDSTDDLKKIGESAITIFVLDEMNMESQDAIYARDKLIAWLSRQPAVLPQPTAIMSITYTNLDTLRDFTQNRDALLAVLKKHSTGVMWRVHGGGKVGEIASQNLAATLGALERISQAMRGVPGRKNLIWVGDGFQGVSVGDTGRTAADEIGEELRRMSNVMLHSRVTLSIAGPTLKADQTLVIASQADNDMASSTTYDGMPLATSGQMTFGGLASPTGGHSFSGRNDLDAEIGRAVSEGQSYYTVSYRPSAPNDNPKEFRNIKVQVDRPGLVVQTRNGYFGEPAGPLVLDKNATQRLAFDLNGAALSPLVYTDLHMTVEKTGSGDFIVHAAAKDIRWSDLPDGRRHADVVVEAACLGQTGRLKAKPTFDTLGSNTEASLAAIGKVDAPLHVHVDIPPGTYRVRFVVRDMGSGRVGTVDYRP